MEDFVSRHGGVVPLSAKGGNDQPVVALAATSEVLLGDRVVVRVIPEQLAPAEVRTHEWLGLTSGDQRVVGAAMVRAVGFPAWPLLQDPDNAQHALNLVAELEWARRQARGATGKVARRFDEIAQTLAQSVPHFIPTFFEELARIFDSVGSQKYALRYFGKAREAERTYGLDIDPQRHREAFLEFGRRGLISAKELSLEATSCAHRFADAVAAYRYFFDLNVDRMKAGTAPYVLLTRDLCKLGRAAGLADRDVARELLAAAAETPGMKQAPTKFLAALGAKLGAATIKEDPGLFKLFTQPPSGADIDDWCAVVSKFGVLSTLKQQPEAFRDWVEAMVTSMNGEYQVSEKLLEMIASHADLLRGQPLRIGFASTHVATLAALERCGVCWEFTDSPEHTDHLVTICGQLRREQPAWDLAPLVANPDLFERLLTGYTLDGFLRHHVHGVRDGALDELTFYFMRRELETLRNGNLLPALTEAVTWMPGVRAMNLPKDLQEFMESATDVDAAEILAENLRAGLLTEFTWPVLEQWVSERLKIVKPQGDSRAKLRFRASYPGVVACFGKHCAAFEADDMLCKHKFNLRQSLLFAQYFAPDRAVLQVSANNYADVTAEWSTDAVIAAETEDYFWYYKPKQWASVPIAGGRLLPFGVVHPDQSRLALPNSAGQVFSTSDGRVWRCTPSDTAAQGVTCVQVSADDGAAMGEGIPEYFAQAPSGDVRISAMESTVLAAANTPKDSIVPQHEGNVVCLIGAHTGEDTPELAHLIRLGDGTEYTSNKPMVGVIDAAGLTRLVDAQGSLYVPDTRSSVGQLARTLDHRGGDHWMHALPWTAWPNLQVRDPHASQRLRSITSEQAQRILDALDATPFKRAKYSSAMENLAGSYAPVHSNCAPDAPAMNTTAEILGTADAELCASVIQLAMQVNTVCKRLRRNHRFFVAKRERSEQTCVSTPPEASTAKRGRGVAKQQQQYLAVRECEQLANALHSKPGARAKRWVWMHVIGNEKPTLMWAQGPLVGTNIKESVAEFMRAALQHGLIDEQWRHLRLNWQELARQFGKSHMGMKIPATDTQDAVLVQREQKGMRAIVRGTPPETINGSAVESLPEHALSPEAVNLWLAAPQPEPETWRANIQPIIDAITQHCAMTPRAALVLLAGGYHPNVRKIWLYQEGSGYSWAEGPFSERITDEEVAEFKQRLKALKLTQKTFDNTVSQLEHYNAKTLELLLAAAFDHNIEAVIAIAQTLPRTKIQLTDEQIDRLLGWHNAYLETPYDAVFRAANPLPAKTRLKGGYGYGRLAGTILQWATYAEQNDPLREFYADQLEALKTIEDDALRNEQPTTYPLQGAITPTDANGHIWLSSSHSADAIRAVKEGMFDTVIAALRQPPGEPGCVMDPRNTAPETVADVQQTLNISEHAATYFLQLLSLVDCTDRNIKHWNNWKKKDLDQAREELLATGRIVEAKRSRAGRTAFLPGVWLEATSPNMPMEEWKIEYYLVRYEETNPKAFSVVPWCPPTLPAAELYPAAWQRYAGGDEPTYETLTTQRYRRRR